ncbi:hypothetical protein GCM10009099_33830 [Caenispirillum bisanense]
MPVDQRLPGLPVAIGGAAHKLAVGIVDGRFGGGGQRLLWRATGIAAILPTSNGREKKIRRDGFAGGCR